MSLKIGNTAPDFTTDSTEGFINFHEWIGDSWCIFMSHPADFTPVCTTEMGAVAKFMEEFAKRNTKIMTLSLDKIASHHEWILDINETQNTQVNFPIIADESKKVSKLYGMLDSTTNNSTTVRSLFIIDEHKKIRLTIAYPASTGRNLNEVVRVLDSLQLSSYHNVGTPANWEQSEDVVILPSVQDKDIPELFPKGCVAVRPYLRVTPQPNYVSKEKLDIVTNQLENTLTSLKELNKKLTLKNKQLEEFTYVASHDLQEPIRTITSMSSILLKKSGDLPPKTAKMLGFIDASAKRMRSLVKSIMEHMLIGRVQELTEINCNELIDEIRKDLAKQIEDNQVEFRINKLPTLQGYRIELRQLFQNLISNAIKFRKPDVTPIIEINSYPENSYHVFKIKDNGIGLNMQYQDLIFKVFQRLHNKKEFEGTGIGLANCKKITELHNGKIWLDSTPGEGSSFYFTIKKHEKS